MDQKRIYLDYNATSPLSQSVSDWLKSGDVFFANPSSQHSLGKSSRKTINECRSHIFNVFNKNENETKLFFHSGATEAMMTFAHSFSEWARLNGKELLICFSKIDHPCVTSIEENYFGSHVKTLELKIGQDLDYDQSENLKVLQDRKDNNPDLVILYHHLWVHNETGIVAPLSCLSELKKIPDLYIHVDAVQAPGKIPNWKELEVGDIFSFSAHKFGALKGIGFSFLSKPLFFLPLFRGGGQQENLRAGTENPLGVKTVSLALHDLVKFDIQKTLSYRLRLEQVIRDNLKGIGGIISDKGKVRNTNTIYFYLKNYSSDIALAIFDVNGLMISSGSACSSGAAKASLLMKHLGFKDEAKNGLRLSLPFSLTESEYKLIENQIKIILDKLK